MSRLVRLAVDFENDARRWWDGGGRELWEGIAEDAHSVLVDEHLAQSWLCEAARIPGWSEGHEFAPHPIALREIDPDEELQD